ncbi:MAG: tape measure protein [Clostridia bacterium]|nr:tape measure protein [Clostridia bacterium]
MIKELFSLFGTIGINNEDANSAIDETNNKAQNMAKSLANTFETVGNGFINVGQKVTSAGKKCSIAIAGIVTGLGLSVKRFDTLNNYPKVLRNLGFSAEDAQKSINDLSAGIDGLPTALDDAASGVQRLVAKNNDINKSTRYFLAMNDAIVAGNAPAEQQASAIEQLTQAYSKGKPDLMEWRTLMMAMPGQLKQIAVAMGYLSSDELYEALKDDKISMDDFMDAIVELDENGSEGILSFKEQAQNSCDSIGTAITNVSNRIKKGFATILTSMNDVAGNTSFGSVAGMINSLSTAVKNFLDKIGSAVKENKAFNTLMSQIGNAITKLNDTINGLSPEQLDKIVTAIVNLVKAGPMLLVVGKGISTVGSAFKGLSTVTNFVGNLTNKVSGLSGIISKVPSSLEKAKNGVTTFIKGISSGFGLIFSEITPKITGFFGNIGNLFSNFGGKVSSFISPVTSAFSSLGGKIGTFLTPAKNAFDSIILKTTTFAQLTKFNIGESLNQAFPNFSAGINKITSSFGGLFNKITPMLQKFLPTFTKAFNITAIAGLVVAGLGLLQENFGEQINQIATIAIEQGPTIISNLINGIVSKIPDLIEQGSQLIQTLLQVIIANLPSVIQGGIQILSALVTGVAQQLPTLIPMALELILTLVTSLLDNIDKLIDAGISLLLGLADGLIEAIPVLLDKVPEIIEKLLNALINNAPKIISAGWQLITKLASGIVESFPKLVEAAGQIIETIWGKLKELPGKALEWGKDMVQGFINGIKNMLSSIGDAVKGVADKIKSFLHFSRPDEGPLREYETWMPDMIDGLSKTLEKSAPGLYNATKNLAKGISESLNFSEVPETLKTTIVKNVILNDDAPLDNSITAYSIARSSIETDNQVANKNSISRLCSLLEYYLPLILRACGHEISIDGKTLVGKLLPIIDEELAY